MSDLDERLKEVLEDKGTYLTPQELVDDILRIHTLFRNHMMKQSLMTPDYWYERFCREILPWIEFDASTADSVKVMAAAKRATGILE